MSLFHCQPLRSEDYENMYKMLCLWSDFCLRIFVFPGRVAYTGFAVFDVLQDVWVTRLSGKL